MRPRSQLKAFDYADLSSAKISDVVIVLKNSGRAWWLTMSNIRYVEYFLQVIFPESFVCRLTLRISSAFPVYLKDLAACMICMAIL